MAALNDLVNLAGIEVLEEAEIMAQRRRRFHVCDDPFDDLTDNKFVKIYRLTKGTTLDLIDLLQPHIAAPSRVSALTVERKILTALRFYASGSYQDDIGANINHAISQSSVSRCITEVTNALITPAIFNHYVKLPQNIEELRRIRRNFYINHHFPGVLGCVDCTHIAIFPPNINNNMYPEAIYVNRKGYHSINTQLICDTNLKILNVCSRFPGSTHDSYIWNNSNALRYMQNLHRNGHTSYSLLGDAGYALRPWLLTPIADAAPGTPENYYNDRHKSTRSLIERCNGVLKLRFRCLLKHRVLHYSPVKCCHIINGCSVLHNICTERNIPPVDVGDDEGDENLGEVDFGMYNDLEYIEPPQIQANRINPDLIAGRRIQQLVIRSHFT